MCAREKNNFMHKGLKITRWLSVCLRALTQQTRAHFTISAPNCKLKLAHNK
ncbi:unnamed protein product [Ectocarpus sp. CCAP 1310/34]|nr:unnamed protein product [Ectocarpus sp. CCAP 1310/34]